MVRYLDRPQEENFIKAYYQLSPFTITPTNIFANYSKECATWWYVGRRAAARAAEKLAGYVSKGLRTALEVVPSVTTKIRSFALMEEKMYYGLIFTDNPYKGCFECFCSLPNFPLMVDHPDKIQPGTTSPPLSSSSRSDITPRHDEDEPPYAPHSPTPSPPASPPPIVVPSSASPPPTPPLPGFWLNTNDSADYYPFTLPIAGSSTILAKYIKYEGGSNPHVLGTMGPNQPVYAKPITLPLPPVTNPLPLSPQQRQQLLFGSKLEDQINEAITDMGELPFCAELECFWWAQVTIQTNLDLVHQYQQCYQDAVHRRELCARDRKSVV